MGIDSLIAYQVRDILVFPTGERSRQAIASTRDDLFRYHGSIFTPAPSNSLGEDGCRSTHEKGALGLLDAQSSE